MKPITFSFSELSTWRQCPHKWELGYRERWTAPTTSDALSRGILWHQVLETHYRLLKLNQDPNVQTLHGNDLAKTLYAAVMQHLQDANTGRQTDTQQLVEWMYRGHLERWGLDHGWKILAVEHAPVVPLRNEHGRATMFRLKLKIDLVIKDEHEQMWIVDHKSCRDLPKDKELDIDDQFGLYTWAMRQLGRRAFGSIHSSARTLKYKDDKKEQPLDERFARKRLYRTDTELDTIALEAYRTMRAANRTPPGEAPRSPDPELCRWRCDYTEACLAGRKGMDERGILRDTGYQPDFTRH